jgi:alpha-beta hydrolase superfamily lysophospholipase
MKKMDSDFFSKGARCSGTLYLPDKINKPPVVIMAHGLGAEQSFRLPAFAERFAAHGLAAFTFDYRCYGKSEGEPRHLINPWRQIQDWLAAIQHVRSLKEIDSSRIALWGSSFAGGHVLAAAAKSKGIAALVSQVPFVNGWSIFRLFSPLFIFKATLHGIRDIFRITTYRKPHLIPIIGKPDTFALMNTHDSWDGYSAIIPKGSGWKNECPARILLMIILYRPMSYARKIKCPALFMVAEKDTLIDWKDVKKTAERMDNATTQVFPIGHFEAYVGELFEKVSALELNFLRKELGVK